MKDLNPLTRRDALKAIGAGAVLFGLGLRSGQAQETPVGPGVATTQPFTLPPLGYAYDALEPHIDARTMEIHYTKHHQGYINNANKVLSAYPELRDLSAEMILRQLDSIPEKIRMNVRNNVGGHFNHALFWRAIGPQGEGGPAGQLAAEISRCFGSFEEFKLKFADAAMKRFGSGWAWLCVKDGGLVIQSTANQDSPLSEGAMPVLGLDVWEHAYYLKYQNRRADYVAAVWRLVDWEQVQANHAAANAG